MYASVVLPVYNGSSTLDVQLAALARQNWVAPAEVLIIDNGSTDASVSIAEGYRNLLPDLRIVSAHDFSGPRKGVDHSYRVGLREARGDVFLFCEADDEVGDEWFSGLVGALKQRAFVAAAIDPVPLNKPALARHWVTQVNELPYGVAPLWKVRWAFGCAIGFRRSLYDLIGGPASDCGTSWDIDFCWRAFQAGIELEFVPEAKVAYRLRHGHRARFKQGYAYGKSEVMLLHKYDSRSRSRYLARKLRHSARTMTQLKGVLVGSSSLELLAFNFGQHFGSLSNFMQL